MATQQDENRKKKWTLKTFFLKKGPGFWTFEASSWILISNRLFWPDINFVLKCLPAHCDMFRIWASHNCHFWTPTKLSQWIMHFVPIFFIRSWVLPQNFTKAVAMMGGPAFCDFESDQQRFRWCKSELFWPTIDRKKNFIFGPKKLFYCAGLLCGWRNNWAKLEELSRAPWLNVSSPPLAGSLNEPCLKKKASFKRGAILSNEKMAQNIL